MKQENTYIRYSVCNNCKFLGDIKYQKNTMVSEKECPECGCFTLQAIGDFEEKMSNILGYKAVF